MSKTAQALGAALVLTATPAIAQSAQRIVVVVASPGDPRAAEQSAALDRDAAALRERDVAIKAVSPETARRERPDFGLDPRTDFAVLLIGKDGGVKLRRDAPVSVAELSGLIDAMPMRRDEMRRRKLEAP